MMIMSVPYKTFTFGRTYTIW